jgi:xylulokinase
VEASSGTASAARRVAEHILTVDLGTSGPKVALFTPAGEFVDGEFEPVELLLSPGGGAEQRPADWWSGIVAGTRRLLERAPVPVESIVAVSVTSQWSGTVPVDRDGNPLHDAIIWMDSRGARQVRTLVGGRVKVAGYDPRKLRTFIRLTGGAPAHSGKDPIAHILWLQSERPDIARATWKYLEPKDWLNLKLTGRAAATFDSIVVHWLTDNRDLSRIAYAPELLALSGIDRDQLPDLIAATDVLAPLRADAANELGVPAGIPVVGGTPDLQSAAVGSGAVRDFEGHIYLGTSSWLTCHVPFKKTDVLRGVASLPSPLPGKYYVADEQETAGACLNYLRDRVFFPDDGLATWPPPPDVYRRFDELAATVPAGSHGVIFTPWLNGERTPVDDHTVRAAWVNQSLSTTRADLVRATLEGVAFNSRWLLGAVERFVGRRFDWLNAIGGGAASDLWCQIHADVLDRPIRQVEHPIRANARGAALIGGLALGRISVDDIGRRVNVTQTFAPQATHRAVYDELFREFRAVYKQNRAMYRRLNGDHE